MVNRPYESRSGAYDCRVSTLGRVSISKIVSAEPEIMCTLAATYTVDLLCRFFSFCFEFLLEARLEVLLTD